MYSMYTVVLFVALCVLTSGVAGSTWRIVDKDFAAISLSLSFQDKLSGWVAGSSDEAEPLLFHTTDGGETLKADPIVDALEGVLMSIDLFDGKHGVAGCLGFVGLPCGVITNDGQTWYKINDGVDILCAVQDVKAPAPGVYVMIGEFSHPLHLAADGIQLSTDGGISWSVENWKQDISARYGWFLDAKVGYVTGGDWPDNNDTRLGAARQISHYIHHDGKNFHINTKASPEIEGYQGLIALTVDGGKSWKTLQNWTQEGTYFNEVNCVDQYNCWVVAEGVNKTTGTAAAYIYGTTDGFATIKQQYYFEHGSLIAVNMLNTTYGWATGADMRESGLNLFKGSFFLTTDGKTWTETQQIGNFYAWDVSTIDTEYAYSAGINEVGLADLAKFEPI